MQRNKLITFQRYVLLYFQKISFKKIFSLNIIQKIAELYTANGVIPVYKICYKDTDIAFYLSRVGAPACVVGFEEIVTMSAKNLFCSVPVEYWTMTT